MASPTLEDVRTWRGKNVVDSDGSKIGSLEDIYLDRQTGEPQWAAIKTGLFGSNVSFAPLEGASPIGDDLRIAYSKDQVKGAPNIDADGELSVDEERQLWDYYGRGDYGEWDQTTDRTEEHLGREERYATTTDPTPQGTPGVVGNDVSGRETDSAMTRSEEELRVGTTQRETGRARLRKYIVSDTVTETVPVSREEVRVEREPITEANVGQATSGPELSEEEHEVTLRAEEPIVEKRVVPKERVRLDKDTVTEQETVSADVRKEEVEIEGDVDQTRRTP
jgi:uncharacterized protein (TIGR02271 family)